MEYAEADHIPIVGRMLCLKVAHWVLTPDHRLDRAKARPLMITGSAIREGCFPPSIHRRRNPEYPGAAGSLRGVAL
jgi:hypothetical protein